LGILSATGASLSRIRAERLDTPAGVFAANFA